MILKKSPPSWRDYRYSNNDAIINHSKTNFHKSREIMTIRFWNLLQSHEIRNATYEEKTVSRNSNCSNNLITVKMGCPYLGVTLQNQDIFIETAAGGLLREKFSW